MKKWKTVIEPKTKLLDIPLKELCHYWGLIQALVKRNYQVQYKQTILGPFWMIIGPIVSSGLFSFVFGYVGQFSSDGIPYFLFYMTANTLWGYFSGCMYGNSSIFLSNAYLFGKVYFPRMVVPVSNVLFELIRFLIQMTVCAGVWLFFFVQGQTSFMGVYLLLVPFLVLVSAMLGMSIGMIISSLTTKYRDLNHCVNLGMQLLLYGSPVLYSVSQLPVVLQKIIMLNPMTSVIEAFRYCITGSGMIHWGALGYSVVFTLIVWLGSMILFNQTEKTFIDIV